MPLLAPGDFSRMPWPARQRRAYRWRAFIESERRRHLDDRLAALKGARAGDAYHLTLRLRRSA